MMKVSHPIVFGHCVKIYYKEAFEKHGKLFDELGINVNNGMAGLYEKSKLFQHHYVKKSSKTYMLAKNTVLHLRWLTQQKVLLTSIRLTTLS